MRFQVLGPLQVQHEGVPVVVRGATQRRILVVLLTRPGGRFPVSELVDALWPDDAPPNAVKNVQSYIAKLKQALSVSGRPMITSAAGGYRLSVEAAEVDAQEFAGFVRRARDAYEAGDSTSAGLLLDRAFGLWRGRPYGDMREWAYLYPEIERLNHYRLEAMEVGLNVGRHDQLLPDLSALVEENPYQERPAELLMRALYASGRHAEAQEVYRRTRTRLSQELGIEPSIELRDLHQAMLRGDLDLGRGAGTHERTAFSGEIRGSPTAPAAGSRPRTGSDPPLILVDRMLWPPKGFQERADKFDTLKAFGDEHASVAVCAVTGAPGVGKTQLVGAYARARLAEGWSVVWVNAESREEVVTGLAELADILGLRAREEDSEQAARRARRRLGELRTPGLLVLDNASDPGVVREWLPSSGSVQVVLTSNRRVFGWVGEQLDVGVFTPAQAQALLHDYTGRTADASAGLLAESLGYHPLALSIAAAAIKREHLTFGEYLRRLNALPLQDVLGIYESDPYPRSMADTILMSLATVEEDAPGARSLAELIAVLAPAGTTRSLMVPGNMDEAAQNARSTLLGMLLDASLLSYREDGRSVVMHGLTRRIVWELAVHDSRSGKAVSEAVRLLGNRIWHSPGEWDRASAYENLAHLEALFTTGPGEALDRAGVLQLIELCTKTIQQLHELCDDARADALNRMVHTEQERLLGTESPETLNSRRRLAREYRRRGQIDEAIALLEQTKQEQERVLGRDHVDALRTRYDLAGAHLTAGRGGRARALLEHLAADQRRVLPTGHWEGLVVRQRLAHVQRGLGELEPAAESYGSLVPDLERVLGRHHPQTLRARSDLGCLYRAAGRLDDAIVMFERTLNEREEHLGIEHPDTRHEQDRLAGAYRAVGRHAEALKLFTQTLVHWEQLLGTDHPWTLMSWNNLACAHEASGRRVEAIKLLERALPEHERMVGPESPRTMNVRNNLACCYLEDGRVHEAIGLFEQALTARRRVLGPKHPDTRTSQHNIAVAYERADLAEQAGRLWEERSGDPDLPGETEGELWWRKGFAYASGHGVDETIRLPRTPSTGPQPNRSAGD